MNGVIVLDFNKKNDKRDYHIKYDRLSKTKSVIKLYRNNLSIKRLEKDSNNLYILSEELNYKGCVVKINIIFKLDCFSSATTNSKAFKIKGSSNDFTIFSRTSVSSFPTTIKGETPVCIYNIRFEGTYKKLKEDFEFKRIREKAEKRKYQVVINNNSCSMTREIPSSVKWSVSHPYQGGKVSPK